MSRKATTASSSYSTSAGLSRATIRQNTQSSTDSPSAPAIIAERQIAIAEGVPDGNVSEVQAQDPEEREPREARQHVVPQELPRPPRPREDPSLAHAPRGAWTGRRGAGRPADLRRSGPEGLAVSQQRVAGDDGAPLPQALGEVETALLAPDLAVAEQRARQDVRRRRRAR